MYAQSIRKAARYLRSTALHPQRLLEKRPGTASWVASLVSGRSLDVGCAGRRIQKHLPAEAHRIGLDCSVTGKQIFGARPDVFADANLLPFADASIDSAVMLEVIEQLRAPQVGQREIHRVPAPGGCAPASMPFPYPVHDAPLDYQRMTEHGLVRDMQAAGLRADALAPTLGSAETAGLIACLATAGMALRAWQQRTPAMLPLLVCAIAVANLLAWLAGRVGPSWNAITNGYRLMATQLHVPTDEPQHSLRVFAIRAIA